MDKGVSIPVKRAWGYRHAQIAGIMAQITNPYVFEDLAEELFRITGIRDNHTLFEIGELFFQFSDGVVLIGTVAVGPDGRSAPGLGDWAAKPELPGAKGLNHAFEKGIDPPIKDTYECGCCGGRIPDDLTICPNCGER